MDGDRWPPMESSSLLKLPLLRRYSGFISPLATAIPEMWRESTAIKADEEQQVEGNGSGH